MTTVRYHEAAEDELLDEIGYLELQATGLGQRFLAEIRRTESLIAQFPESANEIRPGIRKRIMQEFRTHSSTHLLILAVAHHSRRPGYWLSRVRRK